jgi:ABC-type Mn2+/Zn2+ transport system ATPase subunit
MNSTGGGNWKASGKPKSTFHHVGSTSSSSGSAKEFDKGGASVIKTIRLSKLFHDQVLFRNATLSLEAKEKVGLVGSPLSGKTTLLRIILGLEDYQEGQVSIRPFSRFGYLPQEDTPASSCSVGEVLKAAQEDLFYSRPEDSRAWARQEIVSGLAIQNLEPQCPLNALAPDEQYRVQLASLLIARPEVLVLDEFRVPLKPSIRAWLEAYLPNYEGAMIVVSGDWVFLQRVVDKVWEIRPAEHAVWEYPANDAGFCSNDLDVLTDERTSQGRFRLPRLNFEEGFAPYLAQWDGSHSKNRRLQRRFFLDTESLTSHLWQKNMQNGHKKPN